MKTLFKPGYTSCLGLFVIEGLAILWFGIQRHRYPMWTMLIFAIAYILFFLGISYAMKKRIITENAYKIMQCIVFIICNILFGGVCDSAQVFIYSMFFSTVAILAFMDKKLSKFYMMCVVVSVIGMGIVVFKYYRGNNTIIDYTIGTIVLIITNGVAVSICRFIEYQNSVNLEQERSLDELLQALEVKCFEAEKATHAKSHFISNMSHEIRTPINAVLGMGEMILRESEEDDIKKYAHDIKSSAEILLMIVNDILDLSKIESGKVEIIPVNYDISSFFNDIYNMIALKAKDKEIDLIFDIDHNIPSEYYGDDIRVRQVMINLLSNAVKYTKKGKVVLKVTADVEGDEAILHYSVKDTGIGIRKEDMSKVFAEFERADIEENRYIEGTGLGMSITVSLLNLMGSVLKVESEYGKGSEFSFDIVQKVVNQTPLGDFGERISKIVSDYNYKIEYIAPEAKILVVDDNSINRNVFCNLLKQTRINLTEADSGKGCLEILEKETFDMVFLDHMMPEMDGIETFEEIKNRGLCKNTPVIMLTANAVVGAKEMYLEQGFTDFISKPIKPDKLDAIIIQYLPENMVQKFNYEKKLHNNGINSSRNKLKDAKTYNTNLEEQIQEDNIEELDNIEEFDLDYARRCLGSEKLLKSTLEKFYLSLDGTKSN